MAKMASARGLLRAVFSCFFEVAFFWQLRLYGWWTRKSQKDLLLAILTEAHFYEEWEAAAYHIDDVLGNNIWRANPASRDYDFKLMYSRLSSIIEATEDKDILLLVNLIRSGLVRNLGNITSPKLFSRAYAGTKLLIEDYVTNCVHAVEAITRAPTDPNEDMGLSNQTKLDLLHDTRQAFGRSVLVLQGGSIFGLCHIGVVKALHIQGLLPRIIAGTATGALMAALVGVHTQDELDGVLSGEGIDLSAFQASAEEAAPAAFTKSANQLKYGWYGTLLRRARRFLKYGYVLDVRVLEDCVRANVGDMTFEEAYQRTKRVLNITVSSTGGGVPSLLNYLTAPNVLIWSAALASNASDALYSLVSLQCKLRNGEIVPWEIPSRHTARATERAYHQVPSTDHERDTPLSRVAELFNVNHFIISQARPYIAPFLAPSPHHSNSPRAVRTPLNQYLMRLMIMEVQHRLTQLDSLGYLPSGIRRLLLDENVPGASLTLVPDVSFGDFARLLRNPTVQEVNYWILRGERSVWPAISALKVRCAVEFELDRGYQLVRRRKPFDMLPDSDGDEDEKQRKVESVKVKKKKLQRTRAASMGAG